MVVTPHSYKSWGKVSFSGVEGECSVLDTPGACNPQVELTGSVCGVPAPSLPCIPQQPGDGGGDSATSVVEGAGSLK